MYTRDTTFKTNYMQNVSVQSYNDNNEVDLENGNYEALSQRDTNNSDTFDNYILSQKFGQGNIEKAILLLFLIILLTGAILYYYWNFFKPYYIKLLLVSSSIDILLFLFYCSLRLQFNSSDWINSFPIQFYNFLDYVLIINFLLKLTAFVIYFFHKITLSSIFLFSGKFLLEIYLLLSCVKMIIFCPGYKTCAGCFEIGVGWIKYLVCCDNQEVRENNNFSEDSSDSNFLNNSIQVE